MNKKEYIAPEMTVLEMKPQQPLLVESSGDVEIEDDEEI